ncbi:MAG: hypothetical protein JWQ49_6159 [Edaphobacter sp.]|nr:hypothetical protein [Edaphobacter sp.]
MPKLLIGSATGQGRRPSEDRSARFREAGAELAIFCNRLSAQPFDRNLPAECNQFCRQSNEMLPPSAITKGCAKSHPRRRRAVAQPRFDQDVVGVRRWRVGALCRQHRSFLTRSAIPRTYLRVDFAFRNIERHQDRKRRPCRMSDSGAKSARSAALLPTSPCIIISYPA